MTSPFSLSLSWSKSPRPSLLGPFFLPGATIRASPKMLFRPILSCCYALTVYITLSIAADIDIALHKRQNVPVGTGVSVSPTSQAAATSTSNTSPISSDSPAPSSSLVDSQSTSQSDSSDDISSSSASSPSATSFSLTPTSSSPTTSSVQIAASTASSATSESLPSSSRQPTSTQTPTPRVSTQVQKFTTTVVTISGSSTVSHIITSSRVEAITPSSTPSTTPGLNSSNGDSGKSGLSSGQKRTIIGVVVGIGGAILLGGLAVVAWRIWGKRKTVKNDDYDPMDPLPGSADHEKTSGGGSSDPFRTHLDQHHNTAGPVNAASNF